MIRRFLQSVRLAAQNLLSAKLRTFLTILGMVIGIAAVFLVMSIGASAQNLILAQVRGIGSNLVGILPGASEETGPPASVFGIVTTTFTNDDLVALLDSKRIPHVLAGSGYVTGSASLSYRSEAFTVSYQGVSADMIRVENVNVSHGVFFTKEDESGLARSMVLGTTRAEDLFGAEDPIGKRVSLGDVTFTVVGVLESRGSAGFSNADEAVYVPLETAQKLLLGIRYLNFARIKVDDEKNIPFVVSEMRSVLRERHNLRGSDPDDFSIRNTADAISILGNITNILRYFLVFVAGISLFVGGIGIMNVMLIALRQRIREVGLRKAIGARDADIARQFLIEAIFLSLVGGAIGFAIGAGLAYFAAIGIRSAGYEWDFVLTASAGLVAFLVSALVGVIFGLYPARRSARVSPMESLRYE